MSEEITTENGNDNGLVLKKEKQEMERNKWRGRRKMAWIALISMNIVTFVLLFGPIPDARLTILAEPITWFYFAMTSVIGAYMGVTTWAHIKGKDE